MILLQIISTYLFNKSKQSKYICEVFLLFVDMKPVMERRVYSIDNFHEKIVNL